MAPALDATPRGAKLRESLQQHGVPITEVTDAELVELATTEHPQGVVAVYEPRTWTLDTLPFAPRKPVVVLDGVQDPGNVGTIARTALAFGAGGLIALPGTADLTNPKAVRAGMGAFFKLPHCHASADELLAWCARNGVALWAATLDGEVIEPCSPAEPLALVFGNEGGGIGEPVLAHAARKVSIPIHMEAESLNVAVAASILLYMVTQ